MTKYQPDEIVDIAINGARITDVSDEGNEITIEAGRRTFRLDDPSITVDRVASAYWPPQPGDLWRSEETHRVWFVRKHQPCGDQDCPDEFELVDSTGDRYTFGSTVPAALRPLTLVHRESSAVKL